jgi:predicted dithiol-disulfide oxidoreductase (DUF899 family)
MKMNFPNESTEYRQQRDQLLKEEAALRDQIESVAALRRQLPSGGAVNEDYVFDCMGPGNTKSTIRLSELFGKDRDTLFLYGFMYGPDMLQPCSMCSSIIDGFTGNLRHIVEQLAFAVVARSPIERIHEYANKRSWSGITLLSSANNNFGAHYNTENEAGAQFPMANVFKRENGRIHHFWASELMSEPAEGDPRHMDLMWPLWNILDTSPSGRGEGYPSLD